MTSLKDLTGLSFGRLTVIERAATGYRGNAVWVCSCSCGGSTEVRSCRLITGSTTSCGCFHKEVVSQKFRKHEHKGSPEYVAWVNIRQRCNNKNLPCYKYYGGRGIKVCERWSTNFLTFLADMGPRPDGMTIDRIENDGGYEPNNCRWAPMSVQNANKRGIYASKKAA